MTEQIVPSVDRRATNQAPPLVGHNVVTSDLALIEALARHGSADLVDDLTGSGSRPARPRPASTACSPTATTPS